MPTLIFYDQTGRPMHPARRVRRGEVEDDLIAAALAAGASRVRVVSRGSGRELRVVEGEEDAAPTTG
jgi:hypothetical protein